MGVFLYLGAGAAAYALAKAFGGSTKEIQGSLSTGSAPGVHVVTPVPTQVSYAQQTGTVVKPPQPANQVSVTKPPVATKPGQAVKPHPNAGTSEFYPNPNQTSATRPVAVTADQSGGFIYSPPGAVQSNQKLPIVVTPTGQSSIGLSTVADVQRALNTLGYPNLVADGKLGPLTVEVIKRFQSANGLPVDGNAGPSTKAALSAALSALASGSNAVVGKTVANVTPAEAPKLTNKEVQKYLNLLGANPKLVEDGALGPKSVSAIKSFQVTHGLTPDGIAGPKTKAALVVASKGK